MKFKRYDKVVIDDPDLGIHGLVGEICRPYLNWPNHYYISINGSDELLVSRDSLKSFVSLCKTCKKADVSCPIYPQDTRICVEYTKREDESKMHYKVGDNAKIVARTYGHEFDIGALVKIIEVRGEYRNYEATNGVETWYVTEDEIEPVTESSPEIAPCENTDCVSDCSNCGCSHPSDEIINEMITDEVNKASHYNFTSDDYEVINVLKAWLTKEQYVGFLRGNIIKYQARYQQKGGAKDLRKAEWYNSKLIEVENEA